MDDRIINSVDWYLKKKNLNPANRNQGRYQANNGNSRLSNSNQKPKKKCNFCQKIGHCMDACIARQKDNAPCYNSKGEHYFPITDNQDTTRVPVPNKPVTPVISSGQDFPHWV